MSAAPAHVVIVGAGITGLAAALHLRQAARVERRPLRITVLEAAHRAGGKVGTRREGGCLIELGPDGFAASHDALTTLVHDVGLADQLVSSAASGSYIWSRGRLCAIPAGTRMGVPLRLLPLLATPLLSPAARLRAALGMLWPAPPARTDDSVGRFYRRRFGNGLVDHLIDPLISTIYGTDADHYSLRALPTPRSGEHQPRPATVPPADTATGPHGPFLTLRHGLGSLITAMEAQLAPTTVSTASPVRAIQPHANGYRVALATGETLDAVDAVILAVPTEVAARLLPPRTRPWFEPLLRAPPATAMVVALAFAAADAPIDLAGTGFLVPRDAGLSLSACTWTHLKWPHAAPRDTALLRCFVAPAQVGSLIDQPDAVITAAVRHDLGRILAIHGAPVGSRIVRWRHAMPRYLIGHHDQVARLRAELAAGFLGLLVAGAAYDGVGLAACVRSGRAAARASLAALRPPAETRIPSPATV